MPLTPEQIALANQRGGAPESNDGRINENAPVPQNKPAPRKEGEPITSMEQLPKEDEGKEIQEAPLEEKKIDFNDFVKAAAIDKEPLVDETVKEGDKLETGLEEQPPVNEDELKKVASQQAPKTLKEFTKPSKPELQPRVVDDLPEELKVHFKDEMSRPAFEKIKPLILEHKTLKEQNAELAKKLENYAKGGLPESYYEHPNAFILTPDYLNGLQTVNTAQQIAQHWEKQFQDVKAGAAEYEQLFIDKDGNLVTQKAKADSTAETTILKALNFSNNQLIQQQAKLEGMAGVHQERHKQAIQWVKQHEDTAYSYFNSEDGKKLLPNVQSILKQFHPSIQSNPLAMSVAKGQFIIGMLATMIQQLQKEKVAGGTPTPKPQSKPAVNRRRLAGPTNADVGGHDGEDGKEEKKEVNFSDFESAKNGY